MDWVGLFLVVAAVVATIHRFGDRVLIYDEGLLLTNAYLVGEGAVPFRDFYSVYPPGIYYLIGMVWKVVGTSVSSTRLLGFFLHLVIAASAGRLAGLASGRKFSLFAAGTVLLWLSPLALPPYAWLAALAIALLAACATVTWAERWLEHDAQDPGVGRQRAFAIGLIFGLVSAFRHDLFAYLAAALAGSLLVMGFSRRFAWPIVARRIAPLAAGTALMVALVWVPTVALGGVEQTLGDLYFNLSRYVMPGRSHSLTLDGPASISVIMSAMLVCLAAPLVSLGLALLVRDHPRQLVAAMLLGVLCLATWPQMLRRFDGWHILYAAPPALAVLAGMAERFASKGDLAQASRGALAAVLMLFLAWPILPEAADWARIRLPEFGRREAGMPAFQLEWRRDVLAFVATHTRPGEPIFVGNNQHRRATFNDLTLYYLAQRPGATRYLQFDPGQVTRAEVQREMIAQLEARRPTVAVLLEGGYSPEPNKSIHPGSSLLDEYVASHYEIADSSGVYRMMLRKP